MDSYSFKNEIDKHNCANHLFYTSFDSISCVAIKLLISYVADVLLQILYTSKAQMFLSRINRCSHSRCGSVAITIFLAAQKRPSFYYSFRNQWFLGVIA